MALSASTPAKIERIRLLQGADQDEASEISSRRQYGSVSTARTAKISIVQRLSDVNLSWHNINVTHAQSGRKILDNVSGLAEPGQLVALMGASGAGKTTLMNTLLARNLKGLEVEGSVLVNGVEYGNNITKVAGYVQQDELFMGTLKVEEHLKCQADLRLPGLTKGEKKARVDELVNQLGLAKCRGSKIGITGMKKGISGGEAKRLSFASELLNKPALLFCDEPTTGLDSSMAESVVNVMHDLARRGHTIICTIHQPSSNIYMKFDKVIFLAGGRLAYFGTPKNSVDFFARCGFPCPAHYNPADLAIEKLAIEPYNELESRKRIEAVCDAFADSEAAERYRRKLEKCKRMEPEEEYGEEIEMKMAPFTTQFGTLLHRSLLDNYRNTSLTRAKFIQKTFMGIFVGLLYYQTETNSKVGVSNVNGALFYLVSELIYNTLFGVVSFLPYEFPLVVREYHDGLYYLGSYYFARALSYAPLFTIDGIIMMLIAYGMTGLLPSLSSLLWVLVSSIVIEQCSAAFGFMLSTICSSYTVAVSVAGPILGLLSLTGGLYANVGQLPFFISWLQHFSWFKYGFEVLAINEWQELEATSESGCIYGGTHSKNGTHEECVGTEDILDSFSFSASNFFPDLLIMVGFIIMAYLIGLFGLWIRVKRAR